MPVFLVEASSLVGVIEAAVAAVVSNSDCERLGASFPEQPAATWSSLAFCVVGVVVAVRGLRTLGELRLRAIVFGVLLVLTGVGSVAYHGLGSSTARWLHDASFLLALGFVGLDDWLPSGRWSHRRLLAAAGVALVVVLAPIDASLTNPALVVVVAIVTVAEVRAWSGRSPGQRRALGAAGALLAVAGAIYLLGRTDGPLCDPDSVFQGHALWHVLTAVALGAWAQGAFRDYRSEAATASAPTVS